MTPSYSQMAPFSAYVALVRGVLVDFGFGSLIEKFEERFGKRVATSLLALVGLGIVAGVVGLVGNNVVKPIIDLYGTTNWPDFKDWVTTSLLPVLVSLVALYFLVSFLTYVGREIYQRTVGLRKLRKKLDAYLDVELAEYQQQVRQRLTQVTSEAEEMAIATSEPMRQRLIAELHSALESRDAILDISKRMLDLLGDWYKEIEHAEPDVALEKTRELVKSLRKFQDAQKNESGDKIAPRPVHDPDSDDTD